MRDTKKIRLFNSILILIVIILVTLGIIIAKITLSSKNDVRVQPEDMTQLNIDTTNESDKNSTEQEYADSSQIKEFLKNYFTWELTEESIQEREVSLKKQLSTDCYQKLNIETDSNSLIEMVKKYDETKEINTSNSTQLVSSSYITSSIFQDVEDTSYYSIQVKIQQKVPYMEKSNLIEKNYRLKVKDKKVILFNETTIN